MLRTTLLYLSTKPRLGEALERVPAGRRLVRRFVAGAEPGDALSAVRDANGRGLLGAITYLGENVTTPAEARHATEIYLGVVDEIKRLSLRALPSLKLTHLGLDLSPELCRENVREVLERARPHGTVVWLDMESSAYTERTLTMFTRLRGEYDNVACVLQTYLRRTPADLERVIALGGRVRLCKGAYREGPGMAFPRKADVDAAYRRLTERLLSQDALHRGTYPGFATHDPSLLAHIRAVARQRAVPADRFELQMLYGIRPELYASLLRDGLQLRLLVPFGEDWYGYFVRRLAERPANLLFFLRHLWR